MKTCEGIEGGKLEQVSLGLYFIQQKLTNLLYELQDNKIQHANIWEGNDRGKSWELKLGTY